MDDGGLGCISRDFTDRYMPKGWHVYQGVITTTQSQKCIYCDTLIVLVDGKIQYEASEKLLAAQLVAELKAGT